MPVQQTLATPIVVEGVGLHTGASARVELRPAAAFRGRVFLRDGVEIPAHVSSVTETRRCTTVGRNGVTLATVEHLLAALFLAGIDNVEILVDGLEIPALDGAAAQWYRTICAAGICPQEGEVSVIRIPRAAWIDDGGSQFFLAPADTLTLYAMLDIPETIAQGMTAGGRVLEEGVHEQVLRARTFGLEREVQALLDAGLARGGSLANALILTRDGYLNAQVWPEEPAWHKVLDLVGDLALIGARLQGHVLAIRAGHRSHVALAERLVAGI